MSKFLLLEAHNSKVKCFNYRPHSCMHCRAQRKCLRARQTHRRTVRFVEDGMVHERTVLVIRWLCKNCHRFFRHLPPFLRRFKRFITPTIKEKASQILSKPRKHYRSTVVNEPPRKTKIIYAKGDGSRLSHTSVWRWVQWMGGVMADLLSRDPMMATVGESAPFEFSPFQALKPKTIGNLTLARRLWLGSFLG